ncbi:MULTISPECIES: transcriptional regulator [Actinomyces]|nr:MULTISPECIES: transcriptional regulator [Actinomyces]
MSAPVHYLGLSGLAERIGIRMGTAQRYSREGRLPTPDVIVGDKPHAVRGWLPETVDAWQANRPGRGARTDLQRRS